jgi:hypothetical protein
MDAEPFAVAITVLSVACYAVVLYWSLVAYLAAIRSGTDRAMAERWLIVVGGLLLLAIVAAVFGSDLARALLVGLAGYLIVRGPFARRAA